MSENTSEYDNLIQNFDDYEDYEQESLEEQIESSEEKFEENFENLWGIGEGGGKKGRQERRRIRREFKAEQRRLRKEAKLEKLRRKLAKRKHKTQLEEKEFNDSMEEKAATNQTPDADGETGAGSDVEAQQEIQDNPEIQEEFENYVIHQLHGSSKMKKHLPRRLHQLKAKQFPHKNINPAAHVKDLLGQVSHLRAEEITEAAPDFHKEMKEAKKSVLQTHNENVKKYPNAPFGRWANGFPKQNPHKTHKNTREENIKLYPNAPHGRWANGVAKANFDDYEDYQNEDYEDFEDYAEYDNFDDNYIGDIEHFEDYAAYVRNNEEEENFESFDGEGYEGFLSDQALAMLGSATKGAIKTIAAKRFAAGKKFLGQTEAEYNAKENPNDPKSLAQNIKKEVVADTQANIIKDNLVIIIVVAVIVLFGVVYLIKKKGH